MAYIISDSSIVLFHNGKSNVMPRTHARATDVMEFIKHGKFDEAVAVIDIIANLKATLPDGILLKGNNLFYQGEVVNNSLVDRILKMRDEGFELTPMLRFLENLMQNPSNRSIQELYSFLEKSDLPITEDGCFLAYKRVRDDYMDCHSGTIDNHVGQSPFMPRNKVDDNCNNTCSNGLHFASLDYLRHFTGDRLMVLKINPRHVVSIPADYDATKGRCEGYEVVDELEMPEDFKQLENHWASVFYDETDRDEDDESDYDDEGEDEDEDEAEANENYPETVYMNYQEDRTESYSNDGICEFAL
jgi:hypothetical protein